MIKDISKRLVDNVSKVIKGKNQEIEMVFAVMLSEGHVLLEDYPGTGKTILARAMAKSLSLDFKRAQFTPDLLPSDITGLYIYDKNKAEFVLKKGPVFTDIFLGDEINRATPRTQSALLEALAEKQVSIDGITHKLGGNFFVIATQNPVEYEGTFPLPEAQMDRFTIKMEIGYPDLKSEIEMLESQEKIHPIENIAPVIGVEEYVAAKRYLNEVRITEKVKQYIVELVSKTRKDKDVLVGASPRACISLMKLSRGYAAIKGRDFVIPDDIKDLATSVLSHRIIIKPESKIKGVNSTEVIKKLMDETEVVK